MLGGRLIRCAGGLEQATPDCKPYARKPQLPPMHFYKPF